MIPRTQHRTSLRRLAALTAGLAFALGVGACTSEDDDPDSTESSTSQSSSGSDSPSGSDEGSGSSSGSGEDAPGKDQSAELFEAYSEPKPVGKATEAGQTLEVFEVSSTRSGTRLAFHMRSDSSGQTDMDARSWSEFPTLVDRSGKTAYQPLTVTQPEFKNEDEQLLCVCTGQGTVHSNPRMQHVLYETLPEGVTSVDVTYGDVDPVTVKVSR